MLSRARGRCEILIFPTEMSERASRKKKRTAREGKETRAKKLREGRICRQRTRDEGNWREGHGGRHCGGTRRRAAEGVHELRRHTGRRETRRRGIPLASHLVLTHALLSLALFVRRRISSSAAAATKLGSARSSARSSTGPSTSPFAVATTLRTRSRAPSRSSRPGCEATARSPSSR